MSPRYLRMRGLATTPARGDKPSLPGRYPVSAATIWRWVKAGKFPAPVQLGPQTTAWSVSSLDLWDASHQGVES